MPTYPAGSPPNDAEAWDDAHRPWPIPKRPWVGFMTWLDLLFAHWPIKASALRERAARAGARHVRRLGVDRDRAVRDEQHAPAVLARCNDRLPGAERAHVRHAPRQERHLLLQ